VCGNRRYQINDFCGPIPSHFTLWNSDYGTYVTELPNECSSAGTGYVNKNECKLQLTYQHTDFGAQLQRSMLQPDWFIAVFTCSFNCIMCDWVQIGGRRSLYLTR
jgi:hypothetical protein